MIVSKNLHNLLLYLGCKYYDNEQTYQFKIEINFTNMLFKNTQYDEYQIKVYSDSKNFIDVYDMFFEKEKELYHFFNVRYKKQIRKYKILNSLK